VKKAYDEGSVTENGRAGKKKHESGEKMQVQKPVYRQQGIGFMQMTIVYAPARALLVFQGYART